LKEGREFELRRESGSLFRDMKCTRAYKLLFCTVVQLIDVCLMIADNEEGCKKLEEHADR